MASACDCVRSPFLTSSARVSPIAFWKAALSLPCVTPKSLVKCETKSLQTADGVPVFCESEAAPWLDCGLERATLYPAAEAVTQTVSFFTATAPTEKATMRKKRGGARLVITPSTTPPDGSWFPQPAVKVL